MNIYIISSLREHLQEAGDGMGLSGWEVDGVYLSIFSLLLNFLVQAASGGVGDCPDLSRGTKTQEYPEWNVEGIN